MRVRDLVELLKGVDQDLPVAVEGCDCTAYAGGVQVQECSYPKPHSELMVLRCADESPYFSEGETDALRLFTGVEGK